jgi:hypothetical protein
MRTARSERSAGYAGPARHDLGRGGAERGFRAGLRRREEALGQRGDAGDALGQVGAQFGHVAPHEGREPGEALGRGGQRVGLLVGDHLEPVLDLAMGAVVGDEGGGVHLGHPAALRQAQEPLDRAAHAQGGVAAARDELARLGEELDLADAARGELEVAAFQCAAVQALVLADAQAHVVRLLDGGIVEVFAPDEGRERAQEALPCRDIARAGARLDVGRALPGAPEAFVVALGRLHREAHGRDRGVGAQAQVGAEHVAFGGEVRECRGHAAGRADQLRAGLGVVVAREAGFVEEDDQVDVGGIVELSGAHLAHGERHHPAGCGKVRLGHAGDLGPGKERFQFRAQRRGDGSVGEPGERVRHFFERPDAAQIGERGQKRHATLGLPQARPGILGIERGGLGQDCLQRGFGCARQCGLAPFGLAGEEAAEVGAAPGGAADEVGKLCRQAREDGQRLGAHLGLIGARHACEARRERAVGLQIALSHSRPSGSLPPRTG